MSHWRGLNKLFLYLMDELEWYEIIKMYVQHFYKNILCTEPFKTQTEPYHLNIKNARYSDPHCSRFSWICWIGVSTVESATPTAPSRRCDVSLVPQDMPFDVVDWNVFAKYQGQSVGSFLKKLEIALNKACFSQVFYTSLNCHTYGMVKTCESRIPSSPNLDKVKVSFDKLNNTDLFHQIHVTPAISKVFPINRTLYFISIGSFTGSFNTEDHSAITQVN